MAIQKIIKTHILLKNDTYENWSSKNPVLSAGEFSYDTTNKTVKIGDGTTAWNNLSSIRVDVADVDRFEEVMNAGIGAGITTLSNELKPLIDAAQATADSKTTAIVGNSNGRARIFNEASGGGAKIEDDTNKTWSFVGVNQPDAASGSYGSMYVVDVDTKTGTRLKMWKEGFTYSKGTNLTAFSAGDEIATIKDIAGLSGVIHFRGAFTNGDDSGKTDAAAFIESFAPVLKGDVAINTANSKEYLAIAGTVETPATVDDIRELGDESIYAKKAELEAEVARATAAESVLSTAIDDAVEAAEQAIQSLDDKKVSKELTSAEGKSLIFNEADGGGAKFENVNGVESFVGVNNGGNGIVAQIYADKSIDGKWNGAKLDVTNTAMYYTVGDKSAAERDVPDNELATKGDIKIAFEDIILSCGTAQD